MISLKTPDEISTLSDKDLFQYFTEHAKYFPSFSEIGSYAIWFGCGNLTSFDTQDLWKQFFKAAKQNKNK